MLITDDVVGAQRTFKLYVQLVKKSQQTAAGDISLQLKRRPTDDPPEHPQRISEDVAADEGVDERTLRGAGVDADSDSVFINHLCWGVTMLVKTGADPKETEDIATYARTLVDTKCNNDSRLIAKSMRAQGISSLRLAQTGMCSLGCLALFPDSVE